MDYLLAKLHRARATQACLSNSTVILLLHLQQLACQFQASSGDPVELLAASLHLASLMKEQAIATGFG